jgi:hypothetical protein
MTHLDICNTSYGKKKGRELNSQKIGNRPNPRACKWRVTRCWKVLNKSYNFVLDLIPIGGLSVDFPPGVLGQKVIWM